MESWSCRFRVLSLLQVLLCFLPFVTPFIDQICVNVGFENVRKYDDNHNALYKLEHNVYVNVTLTAVNDFCKHLVDRGGRSYLSLEFVSNASIGGEKFRSVDVGPGTLSFNKASLGIPLKDQQLPDCCEIYNDKKADIAMYGVKHKNKFLNGWMRVDINIKEQVYWTFVQVSDERGNAIGELVHSSDLTACDAENYKPRTDASITPKIQQFLPCTATGLQEARPSQAIVYTQKNKISYPDPNPTKNNPSDVDAYLASPKDATKGLQMSFTWRLNEYYCNRHAKFRVVLYFLPSLVGSKAIFQRADWLYPKWFGVADIIPEHERSNNRPDCKTQITQSMINKNTDFWIKKIEKSTPANDNLQPDNAEREGPGFPPTLYKGCRTYITRLFEYHEAVTKQPSYGGRCDKIDEKKFKPEYYKAKPHNKSSVDVPHQCLKNAQAEYPAKMENYKEYMEKKAKDRKALCAPEKAKCPTTDALVDDIIAELRNRTPKYLATNATGRYILKSRAYHGAMFTTSALFLIPISNFVARFFKETFLADDIIGIRVWYFIHLGFTFLVINMSLSGLISNGKVTRVWGRSWSAAGATHRTMGWTCIALYVLVIILGPIRPERLRPRIIIMIIHSFLGYFQYFLGLFTLMNSALVPGSPSATKCYKNISGFDPFLSPKPFDTYHHQIATAVTWWIVLDLLLYGLMSLMLWKADRSWDVSRRHYFPLVPIVHLTDRRSYKCFRYRAFVLLIYVFILGIIVIVTISRLYSAEWKGCDCGPMTCTHKNLSPDSVYPEVQCGGLAIVRERLKAKD